MSNWGSTNMHEEKKKAFNKNGGTQGSNDKYLALRTPGVGQNATFCVRFIGDVHKFYTHWTGDKKRKFCLKTASLRGANGEPLYYKQDTNGNTSQYSIEDISRCPYCMKGDDPRPRYASNVIDLNEAKALAAQQKPPIIRLMEFPVTVYESIEYFINNHKILPNDLQYGPAFIIRLEYPKKPNVTAQDIRYVVDWTEVGSCQIAESEWPILSGKMHNLVTEYDPFRQGSQCPIEGFSPQAQSQPVYQQQAAQGGGLSGFSAPITGTPGFAAPVSPLGAPAMASAVAVGPVPTMTAPTVAPAVYAPPTMSVPVTNTVPQAFAFGQPAAVPTIGAQVPQMTVATPPVVAQIPQPQQSEASLMAEVDNVFTSLQPR